MPRPNSKTALIDAANNTWEKMWELANTFHGGAQAIAFDFAEGPSLKEAHWKRDKNMRDILVHLYEWHLLLLAWTASNLSGHSKPFLPEAYTWKTCGDMNVQFWKKHQSTPYGEAEARLRSSHAKVMGLIEGLSNEELFEKKHYLWTGTTNLGSYCISATASHYDWAAKKIRRHIKGCTR